METIARHRSTKPVPLVLSTSSDEEGSDSSSGVDEVKRSTTAFPELFPTIKVTKKVGCEIRFATCKHLRAFRFAHSISRFMIMQIYKWVVLLGRCGLAAAVFVFYAFLLK